MSVNPFGVVGGTARDREEALFDFLAEQARAPAPGVWSHCAAWLRTTAVDVRRLAAHLDHAQSIATL